ncbi:peptidase, M23 family, partial [Anaerococcus hydrogenalis]
YGYAVVIDHGNGLSTLYGHNSDLAVSPGQSVQQGQVIAYAGSTGYSTGPHCHFEVRVDGSPVDPMGYL